MLTGGEHVTFRAVGAIGESEDEALQQYAFFAGNTLFTGTSSEAGSVELLSEFFWFETSRDRGSDFYVGVVKGRTSPKKVDGWRLEYSPETAPFSWLPQDGSALMVRLNTDPNQGNAFRWDWSIPFDDYHWDSYGNVSMNASYGLNANAEGSVQTGTKVDANGVKGAGTVQSKGFFAIDSQVTTRYEVTLCVGIYLSILMPVIWNGISYSTMVIGITKMPIMNSLLSCKPDKIFLLKSKRLLLKAMFENQPLFCPC